ARVLQVTARGEERRAGEGRPPAQPSHWYGAEPEHSRRGQGARQGGGQEAARRLAGGEKERGDRREQRADGGGVQVEGAPAEAEHRAHQQHPAQRRGGAQGELRLPEERAPSAHQQEVTWWVIVVPERLVEARVGQAEAL